MKRIAAAAMLMLCGAAMAAATQPATDGARNVAVAYAVAYTFGEPAALDALKGKKSLRLLEVPLLREPSRAWRSEPREMRTIPGGLLVQSRDNGCIGTADLFGDHRELEMPCSGAAKFFRDRDAVSRVDEFFDEGAARGGGGGGVFAGPGG